MLIYQPRQDIDTAGFVFACMGIKPWKDPTSLEDIRQAFFQVAARNIQELDKSLTAGVDAEHAHLVVARSDAGERRAEPVADADVGERDGEVGAVDARRPEIRARAVDVHVHVDRSGRVRVDGPSADRYTAGAGLD